MKRLTDEQLRDKLRAAISKDFHDLYRSEHYTTDYETQRMVRDIEINLMSFEHTVKQIADERAKVAQEIFGKIEKTSPITNTNMYGISLSKAEWLEIKKQYEEDNDG